MLRHYGKKRAYKHNIYLASTLSFVAGIVNITGWLSLGLLTTNVTGHFSALSKELFHQNYHLALKFLLLILSFLVGAFISSIFMEQSRHSKQKEMVNYVLPISLEIVVLLFVVLSDSLFTSFEYLTLLSLSLMLFSMGLQNALVTQVSKSVVRTTHLTGLITDLGIELSQLLFYRQKEAQKTLKRSVFIKLMIIIGFVFGGILGGFLFNYYQINTLYLVIIILILILGYDKISTAIKKQNNRVRNTL